MKCEVWANFLIFCFLNNSNMKIATKIPKLDEIFKGGIDRNSSTLLVGSPGVEKEVFAQQLLHYRLSEGDHGVYLINNRFCESVKQEMLKFGWDLLKFQKMNTFAFIDCFSPTIGLPSSEKFWIDDPTDFNKLSETIKKSIQSMKNQNLVFIFETLSTLIDSNAEELCQKIKEWNEIAKANNSTTFFLLTDWGYKEDFLKKIKSIFDNVINFKVIEEKAIFRETYSVEKIAGEFVVTKSIPFKVEPPSGILLYVPKILVTGPYNAGKSSVVHALSTKAVSIDRLGTTIALDHGHVEWKGLTAELFGTPGQERFDFCLKILARDTFGVILVIDSTDPSSFPRAHSMIDKIGAYGLPTVVMANKQDLPNALPVEKIRELMKLPEDIPIIPTVAPKKEGVYEALEKLFELIFKD